MGGVPFGLDDEEREAYSVLTPGAPHWLREPLVQWLSDHLSGPDQVFMETRALLSAQSTLRIDLGVTSGLPLVGAEQVRGRMRSLRDLDLLRLVDLVASTQYDDASAAFRLELILAQAQSAYTVGMRAGRVGLVDRVPEGVRTAAEEVALGEGTAGRLLARAWAHVHGLEKNPSAGYADAVRSVEALACPLVQAGNAEATLGSVIAQMRRDGDWAPPLRGARARP